MEALLLEEVETYWSGRAQAYSQSKIAELNSEKSKAWELLIHQYAPERRPLRVLDVGTGPGFLAMVMAGCGHRVTAVDYTDAMLEEARANAERLGLKINFVQMDAQALDFEDDSFDLIITRNLTWNLEDPRAAYREFYRILCPNGRLMNFDANWYLYLFDAKARDGWKKDRERTRSLGYPDHCGQDVSRTMESIAKNLPLSRVGRPAWDERTLIDIGFSKLTIEPDIGQYVWDNIQKATFGSTPMFMISAEK